MNRPLRVGDRVTATGVVSDVSLSGLPRVDFGQGRRLWLEPSDLTLIESPEPSVNSVVVKDGVSWVRNSIGSWVAVGVDLAARKWSDLSDGEVIFEPEPLADWERELLGGGA